MKNTITIIKGNSGQMLLIMLLILTVATTIALSLIGRATVDLSMSNQLEESTRAFNAAEAGIEKALQSGAGTGGAVTLSEGITYDVSVSTIGGASGVYQVAHETPARTTETIWLVNHFDDGTLDETPVYTDPTIAICWEQNSNPAALVITVLYKEGTDGTYKNAKVAFDPLARDSNQFDATGITTNGCGLSYNVKTLNFTSLGISPSGASADTLLALRVRPEYTDTTIAVDSGALTIPKQGNLIDSTGTTGTGVSRRVMVYQQYHAPLDIFDHVIYSQSSFGR